MLSGESKSFTIAKYTYTLANMWLLLNNIPLGKLQKMWEKIGKYLICKKKFEIWYLWFMVDLVMCGKGKSQVHIVIQSNIEDI